MLTTFSLLPILAGAVLAEPPRVLPPGQTPAPVWIAGEDESGLPLVVSAYEAGEHRHNLHLHSAQEGPAIDGALDWLLEQW